MRQGLFSLALVFLFCTTGAASVQERRPENKKIGFREAIQLAVENSPTLDSVRAEKKIRDLEYENSFSVFLPQLDLTATHGVQGSEPSTTRNNLASELSLQLTETLYDNGVSLTKYQTAKLQKEIADLKYKDERDKLALEVALEYFRYALAKTLEDVQKQQYEIVNSQYKSTASQYRQGVKTERDYIRFKSELRRSEIQLQEAKNATEASRLQLLRLLGYAPDKMPVALEFEPVGIDARAISQIPTKAPDISNHYQYRIADLEKKVLENDVYLAKREFWPRLYLTAGATYHAGDYLGSNVALTERDSTSWNALITLRFNLLDWGARSRNISIAAARLRQTENTITNNLNALSAENLKLMSNLKTSFQNYALARELLDLETKSYRFLETEYRNGKTSYLTVVVGLRDLLSAKVQMYTSYFDLRGQLLRYRYHEGELYDSIVNH